MSKTIVDARTWEVRLPRPQPVGCLACGGLPAAAERKLYCSSDCKDLAYRIRRAQRLGEEPPGELREAANGVCRVCGAGFDPPATRPRFCSSRCRIRWEKRKQRAYAFGHFASLVELPHDLAWLARKLSLRADDPRLPDLALKLAEAGKLVVYVRRDGTVGEIGRPTATTGATKRRDRRGGRQAA
jgi:predicted nucleic acid-binding Zn ribbon protein